LRNILFPTGKPAVRNPITRFVLQWFLFLFFLTSLGAYNAGPVPVSWLAQSGFIALAAGVILFNDRIRVVPGAGFLIFFLAWAFVVTAAHYGEFSEMMPIASTLPYPAYITFRHINIISFAATLYLTYWLVSEGEGQALVRWIVIIASVVAVVALYIYLAHMFHLPEPPRNRMGTAGGAGKQVTEFSSGEGLSHSRATGTFREPGYLAEWLILPLFLSFAFRNRMARMSSAAMAAAFALTLSMTGFFSVVAGTIGALLITRPFSKRTYKVVGVAVLVGAVAFLLLSRISVGFAGENRISLGTLVGDRVIFTIIGGIAKSNRSYVYDFVAENPIPAFGIGLGNGNLIFAREIGTVSPVSFLSLYLFTLYSAGYPGMILLGSFLARPIVQYVTSFKRTIAITPLLFMGYLAYLVSFTVGSEELTPWFGITAGLFACESQRLEKVRMFFSRRAALTGSEKPAAASGPV